MTKKRTETNGTQTPSGAQLQIHDWAVLVGLCILRVRRHI